MIEKTIITRCKKGDQKAFGQLYNTASPYIFSIVRRYIFADSDWKDVMQEAFAQIFTKIKTYDETKGEFKPYMRKICINICLMHLRKNKKTPLLTSLTDFEEQGSLDMDQAKFQNLSRNDIESILREMPDGYRAIFLLHIIDEFSYEEISEMLNITKETVRSQMFRAKKWIMKKSIIQHKTSSYGLF